MIAADPATWPWATTSRGTRLSNLENVTIAFQNDPELQALVWYDEFLDRLLTGAPAREWADADDVRVAVQLQQDFWLKQVTPGQVRAVLDQRARAFPRHAVRDWLATLEWDGEPRIAAAFEDYWGAEPSERQSDTYIRAASANFFIGLAARVLKPGCQLDHMVVFEGAQGVGKTTALRLLGGPWYALAHESVTKKDFFEALQGKWLIEVGELDAFSRAEVTRVKTVISTPTDRYRASYARSAVDRPRQCVFAGTTNADAWGHDETGLRRFWPLRVGTIRLDLLGVARAQLFAEAAVAVREGRSWWEMPSDATSVQAARQAEHPWTEPILAWLSREGVTETTTTDVLRSCLKMDDADLRMNHAHDVGRVLKLAGWMKRDARRGPRVVKVWVSPAAVQEA